jgi:glycerol-3-phosphate dehydrogenase
MRIMILGAGVQGTLYGVRLARAGHDVTLIARGKRVEELRREAVIEDALSARTVRVQLPITGRLTREMHADLCLVAVRREQINEVLPDLMTASAIGRIVFMVNHANGSEQIFKALGRARRAVSKEASIATSSLANSRQRSKPTLVTLSHCFEARGSAWRAWETWTRGCAVMRYSLPPSPGHSTKQAAMPEGLPRTRKASAPSSWRYARAGRR